MAKSRRTFPSYLRAPGNSPACRTRAATEDSHSLDKNSLYIKFTLRRGAIHEREFFEIWTLSRNLRSWPTTVS